MAFLLGPLTYTFPASVFVYWSTGNAFSVCQALLFKQQFFKDLIGVIPPPPEPPIDPNVSVAKHPGAQAWEKILLEAQKHSATIVDKKLGANCSTIEINPIRNPKVENLEVK